MEQTVHILFVDSIFPLGFLTCTDGVVGKVSATEALLALNRHCTCDWGELCDEDKSTNELALFRGGRLVSCYTSPNGVKFYIITEADRSQTTILLPEEY